jgi:hypothetical protein
VTRDALTNSVGCALFQYVPAGNYAVSTVRSGWVDKAGASPASKTTTLTAGTVGLVSLDYDQAASATLTVKTFWPGTSTPLNSSSIDAAEINPGAAAMRKFPVALPANPTPTVAAINLFPFKDAYTFWTGSCAGENPAAYTGNANYFTGPGNHALPTNPGGIYAIDVFQPPLNLRVTHDASNKIIGGTGGTRSTNTMTASATYLPPASDTGCSDTVNLNFVTRSDITTNANGWLSQQPNPTFDPGLPFGKWKICVVDQSQRKHITVASYDNTSPAGQPSTTDLATSSGAYATGTTC